MNSMEVATIGLVGIAGEWTLQTAIRILTIRSHFPVLAGRKCLIRVYI